MSKTKWTPQPWADVGATRIWKTGSEGGAIAIIAEPDCENSSDFHEVDIGSKRWNEAMANANLIAAAPELYEALTAMIPDIPGTDAMCHIGICKQSECNHCQRIIRGHAALAKARGEL